MTHYKPDEFPVNRPRNTEFKPLTGKQRKFLEYVIYDGTPQWKAYDLAYPARDGRIREKNYLERKASLLMSFAHIKRTRKEMEEENKERLIEKFLWTKEEAIENLKFVLSTNRDEFNRVDKTYNEQIDLLLTKIEEAETVDEKEKILNEIFELKKKRRNSQINNNAMISAISELNKMHGFNTQELIVKNKEQFEIDKKLSQLSIDELLKLAYDDNKG